MLDIINILKIYLNNKNIQLIINTIITLFLGKIIIFILKKILVKINNNKLQYNILNFTKVVIHINEILIIYLIWENNIKNVITLVSFVSAAITLSLKDLVFNLFSGLYIKISKPFKLEDRIEVDGHKGDVINIGTFSFEILETKEEYGSQSSGIVLILPNSIAITSTLKNLNKGIKYIWNEINVEIKMDSNVDLAKDTLYKIINNIDLVKKAPTRVKKDLKTTTYRMYFNNYDPIIYTEVKDKHIILHLRYIVDPKKERVVNSIIWNEILKEYKNNNIDLIKE